MRRRDVLEALVAAAVAPNLGACDELVVLDAQDVQLIPPITPNEDHYVYSVFGVPAVDPSTHQTQVTVDDVVVATFDRAFVESLTSRDKEHTLQCIGSSPVNRAIGNAVWSGLPLAEVLAALGLTIPTDAASLKFVGADVNLYTGEAYDAGVPASDLDGVWLVWRMNGEALSLSHGAPYRLLVPDRYGVKNVKWPVEIGFTSVPFESFWTQFGWEEAATYKPNTLVLRPSDGVVAEAGKRLRIAGCAYAGSDPIVQVEVSVDGGPWRDALVLYAGAPDRWMLWAFDWLAEEGSHELQARCVSESGEASLLLAEGSDPYHGYDGSMRITVTA